MIFWLYFTCIKISPRQTISSRSLASTLNWRALMTSLAVMTSLCVNDKYWTWRWRWEALALICILNNLPYVKCVPIFSYKGVDPSIVVSLNYSRPTLNLLKIREELCHLGLQTTKAQISLGIRAVWSAPLLFTHWIVSYLNLLQARLHYFYLVSVAEKAGFGMILSESLKTGFVASMLIYVFIFM